MTDTCTSIPVAGPASKDDGTDNRRRGAGARQPPIRRPARPGRLLAIVLTGQFMALLDAFIVNVAAPAIRSDLHASGSELQLVIAGYTIAYAVLLITGARCGDRFGHGRAFMAGLAVFTAASLACGLAGDTGQLIAFRFVQGAGSAVMLPQVLSLIQRTYTGSSRGRALGAYAAVLASGAAAGMAVGGVLVSADLFGAGWRPVFLVNVPIGLLLLALAPKALPRGRGEPGEGAEGARRGFDLPGLVLLAGAVMALTVPLVLGEEQGWPLWGWLSLAGSAVLATVFAVYESRLARRGGAPLIAPRVLRAPGTPLAVARIGLAMALNAGFLFALTLHLQSGLGYSAMRAGLTFVPVSVAFGVIGLNWRRIPERWHGALAPGGFLLAAVSLAGVGLVLRDGGSGGPGLYAALTGVGLGIGGAYSPTLTRALAAIRREDAADASGVLVTTAQLGLLAGVAVFGAVFLGGAGAGSGARSSAYALWATALALAGTAVAAAGAGLLRRRR
ncbi:MFS transporter [Streptomyces sp. NPDC057654]|uniref:MFS transporter n=1 Tax=Streptomyces sp. NPDC057654 TaxID=3346196 RepID=UPI0036A0487E